jgi:inhibitor of KinA
VRDKGYRIFPLGDSALTVEFGSTISIELNEKALALAAYFERHPFSGFIECVPAYSSTTIFYDLVVVRAIYPQFPAAFDAVKRLAADAIKTRKNSSPQKTCEIEVPVDFGKSAAFDLEFVAETHGLSPRQVIDIFAAPTYRVFLLGFLPGFAYMGEVDDRIATPRKESPRLSVPKGSVGIAGKQTGIYSLDSPGGWQIVGRTEVPMFVPSAENPSFLQPGDNVRFVPII